MTFHKLSNSKSKWVETFNYQVQPWRKLRKEKLLPLRGIFHVLVFALHSLPYFLHQPPDAWAIIWMFSDCAVLCLVAQSCPTLWDPMDCSPPGSSVHGILQARILEWVAMPSSRGSSQTRDRTQVSRIAGEFFIVWAKLSPVSSILLRVRIIRREAIWTDSP